MKATKIKITMTGKVVSKREEKEDSDQHEDHD
jgi:hypothetical protein